MKLVLPILLILIIGIYNGIYAQAVPQRVQAAFGKKFPHAQKVKWSMENAHQYEADFVDDGRRISANFEMNGRWVETERDISTSELPQIIWKAVKRDYPRAEIKDVAHVWNPDREQFEIDAEVKGKNVELVYLTNGKLLHHSPAKDTEVGDGD